MVPTNAEYSRFNPTIQPFLTAVVFTLDSLINVLHAYLFLETFSYHHNLISLDIFFTLGLIHSKMLLMV